jgi:hypothetical protein
MLLVGMLMTGSALPIGSQVAEAYDAWNCGTVTHSYPVAAGSASLSSTVYGCGTKVAIRCNPPQTGILLGNLAWTGQTSSRNCPAGVVNYRGHQLGTGW